MGCTTILAHELYNIQNLSDIDIKCLKKLILDFFAASYAGYSINRKFNEHVEQVVFSMGGAEESTVFLYHKKIPAAKAAFMNSLYAHGAELDDGNRKAMGHVGVHVIPAVFALAEKIRATNYEVLLSIAVGYEAYIRISTAAQPGMIRRGYHSTGVAGTLGCAAACAKLLGLTSYGIENAIALATTMTGGLLSYGDSRPVIKPLNPAKAAENGVIAALLASEGIEGPEEALEGANGWFKAVTDEYDEIALVRKSSEPLLIHECYFKLYPSCRHTHCGIDAGSLIYRRINPDEISGVEVYIYPNAISLAGIKYPNDQDEAKFSIQYTLACALFNGTYSIADMLGAANMPEKVKKMISRIKLIPDVTMENRKKGTRGAKVRIILKNGLIEEETVLIPKGDPENPLTFMDIVDKLKRCSINNANNNQVQTIVDYVNSFDSNQKFFYPKVGN